MPRFRARQFYPNFRITLNGRSFTVRNEGFMAFDHEIKVFSGNGNTRRRTKPRAQSNRVYVSADEHLSEGGMRVQSYWRFQYDIDIGGLTALARRHGMRTNAFNSRCAGLINLLQTFDVVPGRGRRQGEYVVNFLSARKNYRPASSAQWEFEVPRQAHSISPQRGRTTILTTADAVLPVAMTGAVSTEVAAELGLELSLEPAGIGGAINAGGSASAGASVDIAFRRRLELTLQAEIVVPNQLR